MSPYNLAEVDAIEIIVLVDNEIDPISPSQNPAVTYPGRFMGVPLTPLPPGDQRGAAKVEVRMDSICCGAHGLSLLITATKGDTKHSLLFDTGPEEDVWEMNVTRLRINPGIIEHIHLSHWHRDHSGGMLRSIKMIQDAKVTASTSPSKVVADVHPGRPGYRGMNAKGVFISLEADPTFEEIEAAGASLHKHDRAHTVLDDMFLVSGEIPRKTAYEGGIRGGVRYQAATETWESDELILDERLVACKLRDEGLVVFTGCSHAGVVNASKHAMELVGSEVPLFAVVGGFHLADADQEKLKSSMADLKILGPKILMPGHCTGWRFKFLAEQEMPGVLVPSFGGTRYTLMSGPSQS